MTQRLFKIESILDFVRKHPESVATRRITREVLGSSPENPRLEHILVLRDELEIASDSMVDGYFDLIR